MSDPLRDVSAGDPIPLDRATWNGLLDAARAYRAGRLGRVGGGAFADQLNPANLVRVFNAGSSITTLDPFGVQAYGDPVTDPAADDLRDDFARRPCFAGATPAAATDQVCITAEPIAGQTIGRAVCSGVAVVRLLVNDAGHTRAVPAAGVTDYLETAESGGYPVLYASADVIAGSDPAQVWGVVLLGPAGAGVAGGIGVADLTEATGAASWQGRTTASGGAWVNGTATGTDDAYPVQIDGAAFTPKPTATTLLWEEPAGSGRYAVLPIQYATSTLGGYLSATTQSIGGVKTFVNDTHFSDSIDVVDTVTVGVSGTSVGTVTVYGNVVVLGSDPNNHIRVGTDTDINTRIRPNKIELWCPSTSKPLAAVLIEFGMAGAASFPPFSARDVLVTIPVNAEGSAPGAFVLGGNGAYDSTPGAINNPSYCVREATATGPVYHYGANGTLGDGSTVFGGIIETIGTGGSVTVADLTALGGATSAGGLS